MGGESGVGGGSKSVGMQCHRGLQPRKAMPSVPIRFTAYESCWLGLQCKVRGKFPVRLNIARIPIANKYCEGKMKRTLKRELKVPEIEHAETLSFSAVEKGTRVESAVQRAVLPALLPLPFHAPHLLGGG